jgi:hypothetical protein
MKTISSGSNHTIGISFENKLVMWGRFSDYKQISKSEGNPSIIVKKK